MLRELKEKKDKYDALMLKLQQEVHNHSKSGNFGTGEAMPMCNCLPAPTFTCIHFLWACIERIKAGGT